MYINLKHYPAAHSITVNTPKGPNSCENTYPLSTGKQLTSFEHSLKTDICSITFCSFGSVLRVFLDSLISTDETVIVNTAEGALRGRILSTFTGLNFYGFQGVPYAQPPVGSLRFKAPQPLAPWEGVRDALMEEGACSQPGQSNEDCLYLNVYTPQLPNETNNSPLAVMVWIHGGLFTIGSSTVAMYGPDYLVEAGVILVSFTYRLGSLGKIRYFGLVLKDQVAVLRWVQRNIAEFGGDPDNVTLFGQSSGGVCVTYHILSPLSSGLFQRAIAQSGSAINPWALSTDPNERAFRLGQSLGYNGTDRQELVDFLRSVPVGDIIDHQSQIVTEEEYVRELVVLFVPSVESEVVDGEEVFLPDHPYTMLQKGEFNNVPLITGANSRETKRMTDVTDESGWEVVANDMERFVPIELPIQRHSKDSLAITAQIEELYFGNDTDLHDLLVDYINVESDIKFVRGCQRLSLKVQAQSSQPVFVYQYFYNGTLNLDYSLGTGIMTTGAGHSDELSYLFYQYMFNQTAEPGSTDEDVLIRMVSMWTGFAKTGQKRFLQRANENQNISKQQMNPNYDGIPLEWKPLSESDHYYLKIDTHLELLTDIEQEKMSLWESIYTNYGNMW
uniref:Carboxylic ester hydrolase n=1 Tax=Timema monikensis TaxID=170555 RepID=A0A7R9HRR3_9NEOP|nr:unnamed protein product [Timema monikensis]